MYLIAGVNVLGPANSRQWNYYGSNQNCVVLHFQDLTVSDEFCFFANDGGGFSYMCQLSKCLVYYSFSEWSKGTFPTLREETCVLE